MSDEPYTLCPGCSEQVTPDDAGVIYGVELVRLDAFGGSDLVEGTGGFFHSERCFARMRAWRRKPNPLQTDSAI
jgi:hypothetical protein